MSQARAMQSPLTINNLNNPNSSGNVSNNEINNDNSSVTSITTTQSNITDNVSTNTNINTNMNNNNNNASMNPIQNVFIIVDINANMNNNNNAPPINQTANTNNNASPINQTEQTIQLSANNNTQINTPTNNNGVPEITNSSKDTMFGRWYEVRRAPAMKECVIGDIYKYEDNFRYQHYKTVVNLLAVRDPDNFKYLTVDNLRKQFVSNLSLVQRKIRTGKTDELKNQSQKDMIPYVKGLNLTRHMVRSKGNANLKQSLVYTKM